MNLINDFFDTKIISSKQIENFLPIRKISTSNLVENAFYQLGRGKIVSPNKSHKFLMKNIVTHQL